MAIIDLVKWDAPDNLYAWKFPSQELATWTQLIVSESQEAVLLSGGQMDGPYGPGRHTLSTENIPIISGLFGLPFGGKSPFTAEVWFVNKAMPLDVKWGTTDPIQLQDPKYQIMLPVRAFGQFGIQVDNSKKFLIKLVGTMPVFDREKLVSYFRGLILTRTKDLIAKALTENKISILEVSAHLNSLSEIAEKQLSKELEEFGLKLINFFINSINTPEDDPAVQKLKATLAKKAEMDILGFTYQQERTFDTLETAAGNEGTAGGVMGAGLGMGMGMGIGVPMGNLMGGLAQSPALQTQSLGAQVVCKKCGANNDADSRFCSKCGGAVIAASEPAIASTQITCDKCGHAAPAGARFCANCGDVFNCCSKCGTDNPEGTTHCVSCKSPMPIKCAKCGVVSSPGARFCPGCGAGLLKACFSCNTDLPTPHARFCPSCGKEQPKE